MKKTFLIVFSILFIDHFLKFYVKTHFSLGTSIQIFPFFWIYFVENPGMAYGLSIYNGHTGKILLSVIRFLLIIFIFFIHYRCIKQKLTNFLIIPSSLVLSGAIGNFLDCILYGLIFDKGTIFNDKYQKWIPYSGISKISFFTHNYKGYAPIMEGCVVDMFYFPIFNKNIPKYFPFFGEYCLKFFQSVFNLSDIVIFFGIFSFFIFKNKIKNIKVF
ncbi:lipoprotein signal peptidase [Blattabacterium cuenoti]|uniref:lipoprotein signal peptidase n=1 Tax=Blattabacterium cuenoti TaxID=1653831 RepID=UPI00163D350B|nr:lipoprotein signal peptidase [Blattabacterium cuenoti]